MRHRIGFRIRMLFTRRFLRQLLLVIKFLIRNIQLKLENTVTQKIGPLKIVMVVMVV